MKRLSIAARRKQKEQKQTALALALVVPPFVAFFGGMVYAAIYPHSSVAKFFIALLG